MGDDFGSEPAEHDGAEMMVRMVMGKDQPAHRLAGDFPNGVGQLLTLLWASQRIDHHDALAGHDECRVRASFGAPASVADRGVDARSNLADGRGR